MNPNQRSQQNQASGEDSASEYEAVGKRGSNSGPNQNGSEKTAHCQWTTRGQNSGGKTKMTKNFLFLVVPAARRDDGQAVALQS
jgi:hypothetical protein